MYVSEMKVFSKMKLIFFAIPLQDYFGVEFDSSDTEGQGYVSYGYAAHHEATGHYQSSHNAQQHHLGQPDQHVQNTNAYMRRDTAVNASTRVSMDTDDLIFDCDA